MKLHLLTLKFYGDLSKLEAPFLSDYYRVSLSHIRISLFLGVLFYAAFGILDALLMPEQKSTIWFIRFIIVCPVIFATLLASFSKYFERYMQPLLAGVFLLAGTGTICIIAIVPPPVNYFHYIGLLIVFLWGYTFMRIFFLWASFAGWVQVILYEIAAFWISPIPFAVMLNNNFYFISANIIGMMLCYSIEFSARRDFFLRQELEIEREKVINVNQDLEERVKKRTADYLIINKALEQEIVSHQQAELQREAALEALRESEEKYRLIFEHSPLGILSFDEKAVIVACNDNFVQIIGSSREVLIGLNMLNLPDKNMVSAIQKALNGGTGLYEGVYSSVTAKKITPVKAVFTPMNIDGGSIVGGVGIIEDITERKQVEEELRKSEHRYRLLIENANEAILVIQDGVIKFVNSRASESFGYSEQKLLMTPIFELIHPEDRDAVMERYLQKINGDTISTRHTYRTIHKGDQISWIEISSVLIDWEGRPATLNLITDITDRKKAEEALSDSEKRYRELSIVDDLTSLYNSRHFYVQLKIELDRANRYEQPLTLLLLDLDNFKVFNDAYGHIEGDQVLQRLGQVVKRCLREADFAYRYGGEEFTILLPMTTSADGAFTAERIRTEFKKEIFSPAPGEDVNLTVSIGLAQYKPQEEMKAFVRRADKLMYQGKKNGKDRVCSEA
jgi:diguanylate cyclase (GGDEF)-like protein/PAS domain S-box-containing protein